MEAWLIEEIKKLNQELQDLIPQRRLYIEDLYQKIEELDDETPDVSSHICSGSN